MKVFYSVLVIILTSLSAYSQLGNKLKDGLKFYIDSGDSSRFIKLNMTNQIWARYNENNPNTLVYSRLQNSTTDISIRRIRMIMSGQLTDRAAFFIQFGQNSFNYLSARKAGSFFHDVTADYALIKKYLSVGFGLNGWNGPSRFSNISTTSILVLDPPNYQEVTNDTYDQFVRRLGIYAKGKIQKLDYRLSAGKPFVIQTANVDALYGNDISTFSTLPPNMVYQGYFMYQFLDQESNFGPSNAGTYLGAKRIFNVGGGFYYQKNAMYKREFSGDTLSQDIMLYSFDVMYDAPLNKEKGTVVSFYACYSNYNFGTNFIKVSGPDNPANGSATSPSTPFNKANFGNAFPYLGTGTIYYAQAAYKFKNDLLKSHGTLQPYADCQYSNYTRLKAPMLVFDAGINWLIRGHNAKFTLNCQNRPYYVEDTNGNIKQTGRKSSIVLQYQLAF